jgi:hypothetical protein
MAEKVVQVAKLVVVVVADSNKRVKLARMKLAMTTKMVMMMMMIILIDQKLMIFELVTLIVAVAVAAVYLKAMIFFEVAECQEK